ncbi:hypothetical protein LEMLEM_LOCUS3954 [Lemmus lemmus]
MYLEKRAKFHLKLDAAAADCTRVSGLAPTVNVDRNSVFRECRESGIERLGTQFPCLDSVPAATSALIRVPGTQHLVQIPL